ncbi:hypothetical protein CGCVW01_v000356 [Colletotrichum viniferum]|nr:hypothetical protein CGCVW01_v000356 [Colletotrichum viniferum]
MLAANTASLQAKKSSAAEYRVTEHVRAGSVLDGRSLVCPKSPAPRPEKVCCLRVAQVCSPSEHLASQLVFDLHRWAAAGWMAGTESVWSSNKTLAIGRE